MRSAFGFTESHLPIAFPGQFDYVSRVFAIVSQPRARLRENRFTGAEPAKAPELIDRPIVMDFLVVQKGHNRAGINEHAFCHIA